MKSFLTDPQLLLKILSPLVLIPILGISPYPDGFISSLSKARLSLSFNQPLEASLAITRAANYFPWRTDLWVAAGRYALQGGDYQSAMQIYGQAGGNLQLSAGDYLNLGDLKLLSGDADGAIQSWQTALRLGSPAAPIYTRLLAIYRQREDYASITSCMQKLVELQPGDAQTTYQLGLLLAAQQPEAALAYLIHAAEIDDSLAPAVNTIQRAITSARLADDEAYTQLAAGRALASLGEWDLATLAFRRATELNSGYAEAWAFLGEALQQLASGTESGKAPEKASLPIQLTQSHSKAGFRELKQAYQLDPNSLSANTFLAYYWQRQMRNDLALVYLHAAADLDPNNPALLTDIGETLARLGNLPTALRYYLHATEMAPRDPLYWRSLANFTIKYEYQVRETGLPAARQAVLLAPKDEANLDQIAQVFLRLDDALSAQRFLARALQQNAEYAPAHLHLGLFYLLEDERDRAYQEINLARRLAPESATADQARRLLETNFP